LVIQVGLSFVLNHSEIVQSKCRPNDLAAIFQIGFIKIGTKNTPLGSQHTKSLLNLDAQTRQMIVVLSIMEDARMLFCATVRNEQHFGQLTGIAGNNEMVVGMAF
jgi:hypothetical protein